MHCNEINDLLDDYLNDRLDGLRREAFRRHLRDCPGCRELAVGVEPTLLFSTAEPRQPDPSAVDRSVTAVLSVVRQRRLEATLGSRRRPWLAAAAALLVAVGGVTLWRLTRDLGGDPPPVELQTSISNREAPTPPQVQVYMVGEGVRVYHYAATPDSNIAVCYIVNPSMEL